MTKLHYVLTVAMIFRIAGFLNAHIVRAAQAVGGLAGVGRVWSADPGKGRGFNFAFALAGGRRCVVGSDAGVAVLSLGDGHLRGWVARTTPKGWRVDCGTVSPGCRYFAFTESRLFHHRERLQARTYLGYDRLVPPLEGPSVLLTAFLCTGTGDRRHELQNRGCAYLRCQRSNARCHRRIAG